MKKGDPITVTIDGRRLEGVVELMSKNGPAAVLFDEGVPAPFFLHKCGKQCELLLKRPDGSWVDVPFDRPIRIG